MRAILVRGNPLKIINAVVQFITINVIHFGFVFGIWDKSFGDQTMHIFRGIFSVYFKTEK